MEGRIIASSTGVNGVFRCGTILAVAENLRLRAGTTVFGWAMAILAAAAGLFWTADVTEVAWMEGMGGNGTGTVIATSWMAAPFLLVLLAVALVRFRNARSAVLLGWVASLPMAVALYVAAYSYSYCSIPGC
jgi:hypothetical protein